jgi:hypothetical protein
VRELTESMGGRLIGWYLSLGEYDGVLIYEAPDDASAGAAVLAAARRGHLRTTKTTPLFTAEEGMEMMRRAGGVPLSGHRGSSPSRISLHIGLGPGSCNARLQESPGPSAPRGYAWNLFGEG